MILSSQSGMSTDLKFHSQYAKKWKQSTFRYNFHAVARAGVPIMFSACNIFNRTHKGVLQNIVCCMAPEKLFDGITVKIDSKVGAILCFGARKEIYIP